MQKEKSQEDLERLGQFVHLRSNTIRTSNRELDKRMENGPREMNDLEKKLGVFVEQLEPQVRNAVIKLNKKGYVTHDSGFGLARDAITQIIHVDLDLTPEVISKIENLGAKVDQDSILQSISFEPINANLDEIRQKWDEIVEILPDINDEQNKS